MGTRLAIGAGRGRLIRQLLTESLLLSALGGAGGLVLAVWGNYALLASLPERSRPGTLLNGSSPLLIHLDWRILGFTLAVTLLTGLLFGLAPALRATRLNLANGVRATAASGSRESLRLNQLLVISQVAMSLMLLVTAGLFVRTLDKLRSVDLGFNPQHLVQISLDTREAGYRGPQVAALYQELLARLGRLPGVIEVTGVRNGLVQDGSTSTTITIPGRPPSPDDNIAIDSADVGPRFFSTVGMPLMGRDITARDTARSPRVIVVNQAFVRRYFPNVDPLGKRVATGGGNTSEIVGVARDAKIVNLRRPVGPTIYFPAFQRNMDRVSAIELRTSVDPAGVIAAARQEVSAINPKVMIDARTMPAQVDAMLEQERMIGKLAGFFGALALLLASGGLYGLMAYSVARRTGEIGVRMALGAQRDSVLWMILRETITLLLIGLAIGVPVALGAARVAGHWIEGLLFEMKATDPMTLILASLMLGAAALVAGAIPAWRASQVDPMKALRCE